MNFIIIPTYNEKSNIQTLVAEIFSLYPGAHILVVDDNSPDGTADIVRKIQTKYPNLSLKVRSKKMGLASAYLESIRELFQKHSDLENIITMDADFSHDPKVIKTMLEDIKTFDLVIGSRYIKGGGVRNWELWRQILSRGGNFYSRFITLSGISDLTGGFNCYSSRLLKRYDLEAIKATGYGFQMEMKIVAKRLGARIKEIPIIFPGRIEGESKISNNIIYEGVLLPWRFSPIFFYLRSKFRR